VAIGKNSSTTLKIENTDFLVRRSALKIAGAHWLSTAAKIPSELRPGFSQGMDSCNIIRVECRFFF